MSNKYKFYMSRYLKESQTWEKEISLEDYFNGMKYVSCTGLSAKGKPKNIYTESYAESSELRVYLPDAITRDTTDIEFEFAFIGENRRDIYDSYCEWVSNYKIKYWDTCRNRVVEMILNEAVEPKEDELKGSEPYLSATFKFTNLKGTTEKKTDNN